MGHKAMRVPELPEWLSPIVGVIPGQVFAMSLAAAKGYDLDQPRGLTKVTYTI
jgi:glucosamine--fructose-6-phosphate aminotransferase (isomerizing)